MIRTTAGLIIHAPEKAAQPAELRKAWRRRNLLGMGLALLILPLGAVLVWLPLTQDLASESLWKRGFYFVFGLGILAAYGFYLRKAVTSPLLRLAKIPERCRTVLGSIHSAKQEYNDFGYGWHPVIFLRFHGALGEERELSDEIGMALGSRLGLGNKGPLLSGPASPLEEPIPAWIVYDAATPADCAFLGFPADWAASKGLKEHKHLRAFTIILYAIAAFLLLAIGPALIF